MFIRVQRNKYDTKGIAGYVGNPDGNKEGDIIEGFPEVSGVEHRLNEEGQQMVTSKGVPLSFIVFA